MNDKIHNFDVEDAVKYGVNRAIVLYTIKNWIDYKARNKKGLHKAEDGNSYYFAYASASALSEKIPYLSKSAINDALNYFIENKILIKGKFNKMKWDKTLWYADASQPFNPIDMHVQNPVIDVANPAIDKARVDDITISHDIPLDNKLIATDVAGKEVKKATSRDDEPQSLSEFCQSAQESPRRFIRVIGEWAEATKPPCVTRGQWRVFLTRNLRAAKDVATFTDEQIAYGYTRLMELMEKSDFLPTLETLKKMLVAGGGKKERKRVLTKHQEDVFNELGFIPSG